MKLRLSLMAIISAQFILTNTFAQTITLGQLVTISSETEDYVVNQAKVTAFSSTDGWTLSRRKCHKSRNRTGQGFPYRYNYESYSMSSQANVTVKGKTLNISGLEEAVERAKEELSENVPFYCSRNHALALSLVVTTSAGETIKSLVSLGQDSEGLYAEKPYGRVYLGNSELDFIPTI